jgi:hypothetical protein
VLMVRQAHHERTGAHRERRGKRILPYSSIEAGRRSKGMRLVGPHTLKVAYMLP